MTLFLLVVLAIAVIGFLASLFGQLNELRSTVNRLHQQPSDRMRAIENRLGAQERLTAQLRLEIAERPLKNQSASIGVAVTPLTPEPQTSAQSEPAMPSVPQAEVTHAPATPLIAPKPAPVPPPV